MTETMTKEETLKLLKNRNKHPVGVWKVLIYIFLVLLCCVYLIPLLWMVSVSVKTNAQVFDSPFGFPAVLQLGNYIFAWTKGKLGIAMLNSLFVCTVTLVVSLIMGSMAAFAIARMDWKLSSITMTYIMIGMMIPVHCVLIPLFVRFSKMGMSNSLVGLIIPYVTFSIPMIVFLMAGFFKAMPREMFEAACIDGCGVYRSFIRIAMPMARVGLFVSGLITFVYNWNELLLALVFISDVNKKTLPVTLTYFVGPYSTNYVQMFAAIIIAIAPTIVVYCGFSNQIVEGMTAGAIKG
jgi:raffinose/stachyose/melibiose transport system permease protein